MFTSVCGGCGHRITEQHSREVSEMDHLLQEELQQVRANQEQNVRACAEGGRGNSHTYAS